jgi:hypothetical protein
MDGELDEAIRKLAWLNFDCSRNELGSCVARLSELKVPHPPMARLPLRPLNFLKGVLEWR